MMEPVQRMVVVVLSIEHTPAHHRVEAAQRRNEQVQAAGTHRRPVGGLDEPTLHTAGSERTSRLQQEQPGVLANCFWSTVPWIAMLGQQAEPGPDHGQVRLPRPRGATS